jgi:hypothetical protein
MTQIGEAVFTAPVNHIEGDDHCPFCPAEEVAGFTTYPGEDNDSSILGEVMLDPSSLVSKQPGARPKDSAFQHQIKRSPKSKPSVSFAKDNVIGNWDYSFEAHHAIPGNQSMKGHSIERWIKEKNGFIKKDTGYSINNSDNGIWLPSIPEECKNGNWGGLDDSVKLAIASKPMKEGYGQFHKSHHNITDKDDPTLPTYKDEVILQLKQLDDLIVKWTKACFRCNNVDPEKGPFDPNWKVHNMLDNLSSGIETHLKKPPKQWKYFISRLAMNCNKNA